MTSGRPRPSVRSLGSLFLLGLNICLPAKSGLASQHGVFDRLNGADLQFAEAALRETLETRVSGELQLWRNDATGRSGALMPLRTFKIDSGHFCRRYRETVVADRKMDSREMTACRSDEGIWVTIEK